MKNILIHGLGQNHKSWNETIKFLEIDNIDVLCPALFKMSSGRSEERRVGNACRSPCSPNKEGKGTPLDELLAAYGISKELKEQFGRMEENFQAYLGKGSVPVRNMQRVMGTKIVPLEQLLRQDAGNVQIEEMQNVPFRVRKILYHIDRQEYQDGSVVCCGWALARTWNGKVLPVDIKAVMPDGS